MNRYRTSIQQVEENWSNSSRVSTPLNWWSLTTSRLHLSSALEQLILDQGQIVADDSTPAVLADQDLMQRHRLELPYGFDPANIAAR